MTGDPFSGGLRTGPRAGVQDRRILIDGRAVIENERTQKLCAYAMHPAKTTIAHPLPDARPFNLPAAFGHVRLESNSEARFQIFSPAPHGAGARQSTRRAAVSMSRSAEFTH